MMTTKQETKFKETEIGLIPEEWKLENLNDFIKVKHGYAFKSKFFSDVNNANVLLTPGNFKIGGGFNNNKFKYYTGEIPNDYILKESEMIITMTDLSPNGATLGYPALVPKDQNTYLHNQRLGLIKFKNGSLDKSYLYWWMRYYLYRNQILGTATGTTVRHTSPGRIEDTLVFVPPFEEQKLIAEILSSLDEKIELNRRMNKTLEEMGKALFKRWFVDFEFPNEEGKPYKSSGGAMVDSELGEIPEGWEVKPLSSIATFLNGLALQKYRPQGDDYLPVVKIRELKAGITDSTDRADINIPDEYKVRNGDLLFSWSGSLELVVWVFGSGALNQHLFKVTSKTYPKWLLYYFIDSHIKEFRSIAANKATTMGHIQRTHLDQALCTIPQEGTLKSYSNTIEAIFSNSVNLKVETEELKAVRDTLLPKLISGKIRTVES